MNFFSYALAIASVAAPLAVAAPAYACFGECPENWHTVPNPTRHLPVLSPPSATWSEVTGPSLFQWVPSTSAAASVALLAEAIASGAEARASSVKVGTAARL